ncbi:MAG: hypothetical protein Q4D29_11285, partial [Lachnospiraceae bacterium]|nr:hypothetical protein [Lachnospiraceae bacterium]
MDDKLDKLFFISEYGKDYYHKTYHIIAGEKHDLRKLGTCNPFGIGYYCKSNIINIVSCSRIIELKRIDLIIKALSMIEDITIDWKHFGDGPLLDDMKELAIQLLSKKHNISYDFKGYTL